MKSLQTFLEKKSNPDWIITPYFWSHRPNSKLKKQIKSNNPEENTFEIPHESELEALEPKALHLDIRVDGGTTATNDVLQLNINSHKKVDIFIFNSGAVVSWGMPGHSRQALEELINKFHSEEGWPQPLNIKFSFRRFWFWQ
eukprot:UN29453